MTSGQLIWKHIIYLFLMTSGYTACEYIYSIACAANTATNFSHSYYCQVLGNQSGNALTH